MVLGIPIIDTHRYQIHHQIITAPVIPEDNQLPAERYMPRIVQGESCMGVMIPTYIPEREVFNSYEERPITSLALQRMMYVSCPFKPTVTER